MQEQKNNSGFNYWNFIEKFYPNYYSCNDVLLCDILTRKLEGEEIDEFDEQFIKGWDIIKEKMDLERVLLGKAVKSFIKTVFDNRHIVQNL
jgi:hypothetical protein